MPAPGKGKDAGLFLGELKVGGCHSEIPDDTSSLISLYFYKELIIILIILLFILNYYMALLFVGDLLSY